MPFPRPHIAALALMASTLLPAISAKPYPALAPAPTEAPQLRNSSQLELRDCANPCGYYGQLCCQAGQQCVTNANAQAECAAATAGWIFSTFYYTETDFVTRTSVWSSYVGATAAQATPTCAASQVSCGNSCCNSGFYCSTDLTCKSIGGGSSPVVTGIVTPSAPSRPTSSTLTVVTVTGSATTTLPFATPIPTGANGTLVESNQGGGGLSGGAIAGIVIGVILGVILLLLICFYCCAKAAFDSILAIFGLGKRRRRTHEETTYIEEHHHSGSAAASGGRRWYGSRPSRPPKKESGGMGLLGLGAGLAGLAAVLGLKRKHDRKHYDDKSTTITDSSYYYSDYTSSSSASSDRHTRHTRHSSRPSRPSRPSRR